jgi:hypothetical protein
MPLVFTMLQQMNLSSFTRRQMIFLVLLALIFSWPMGSAAGAEGAEGTVGTAGGQAQSEDVSWNSVDFRNLLDKNIINFFGDVRTPFHPLAGVKYTEPIPKFQPLSERFLAAFGVPLPAVAMDNGDVLLSAFEPHNATVVAMVVTQGNSAQIVCTALLDYSGPVKKTGSSPKRTSPIQTLTVFYPKGFAPQMQLTQALVNATQNLIQKRQESLPKNDALRVGRFGFRVQRLTGE